MKKTIQCIGLLTIFNLKSLSLKLWQTLFMGKPEPLEGFVKESDSVGCIVSHVEGDVKKRKLHVGDQ